MSMVRCPVTTSTTLVPPRGQLRVDIFSVFDEKQRPYSDETQIPRSGTRGRSFQPLSLSPATPTTTAAAIAKISVRNIISMFDLRTTHLPESSKIPSNSDTKLSPPNNLPQCGAMHQGLSSFFTGKCGVTDVFDRRIFMRHTSSPTHPKATLH